MPNRTNTLPAAAVALAFAASAAHGADAPLRVKIESPASGAKIAWSVIDVSGVVEGPERLGVVVNGFVARVGRDRSGRRVFIAKVPLEAGPGTITASAIPLEGSQAEDSISVFAGSERPPMRLDAERAVGPPPLTVTFDIRTEPAASLAKATIDFDGDGAVDATVTDRGIPLSHTYSEPGLYRVRLASEIAGRPIVDELAVIVQSDTNRFASLLEIWKQFLAALRARDADRALSFVVSSSRQSASQLIAALFERGIDVDLVYPRLEPGTFYDNRAILDVIRPDPDGREISYPVQFSRDVDGNWRVDKF